MRLWSKSLCAALVASATVMACSPADFIDLQLGVGDGASEGAQEVQTVDGNKEQRLTLSTGASLTFAKGAVDHAVEIGVERPSDQESIPFVKTLPDPTAINSAPYVLTPHGTQFKAAVTLELPLAKDRGRELVVAYLENESDTKWKKLGTPTVENGVAKINLEHFSVVILLDAADAKLSTGTGGTSSSGGTSGGTTKPETGTSAPNGSFADGGVGLPFDPARLDAGDWQAYLDGGVIKPEPTPDDAGVYAQPDGSIYLPPEGGVYTKPDAAVYTPPDAAVYTPPDAAVSSLSDNGDGTVTDSNSGLVWEQGNTQGQSAWDIGAAYCAALKLPGTGWRMPTVVELKTLVTMQYSPRIDPKFFPNTPAEKFWTSVPNGSSQHWYVDFASGYENAGSTSTQRTRCVRSLPLK